uniref:Uroporphyrinogen-III synthase n=1 Tax=Panagrellus redivivus TaxID=6233 RepID=A0A7E5A075_PANRE
MPSDVYAFIKKEANVYLFTPSDVVTVIRRAPKLRDAINTLQQAAPPNTIKGVYIVSYTGFEACRRVVEAVQKAGYTVVETIESFGYYLSSVIHNLPLKKAVGTIVFVLDRTGSEAPISLSSVDVLQKCEKGWKLIEEDQTTLTATVKYSSVSDIVLFGGTRDDKIFIQKFFPRLQLHVKEAVSPQFLETFVRNRINNGNLDGCKMLPYLSYDLLVEFGDKSDAISLTDTVPPFTITKEIDVGTVPTVEIHAHEIDQDETPVIKTFKFKSAASRTVLITVHVDKTLLLQVTLKTIATRESNATTVPPLMTGNVSLNPKPFHCIPSIIFSITYFFGTFLIIKLGRNQVFDEANLSTVDEAVAFMKIRTPKSVTAVVFFQYSEDATILTLQSFRAECRKAELSDVRLISFDSVSVSHFLESLQIPIDNGQSVAVLSPKYFYIITRDGRKLKVRTGGPMNEFEVKRCNVKSVIIAHASRRFTKAMLDELEKKFGSNLHIVTDVQKLGDFIREFWWSFVDESVSNTYALNDYCDFDIEIKGHMVISTRFKEIPLSISADVTVSDTSLEVNLVKSEKTVERLEMFTLKRGTKCVRITVDIKSPCDITVKMVELDVSAVYLAPRKPKELPKLEVKSVADKMNNIEVPVLTQSAAKSKKSGAQRRKARLQAAQNGTCDGPASGNEAVANGETLPNELSQLDLNPPPTTILTFTSDNRVLIKADATYTGDKEILAYVRLQSGKAPHVGKGALDALQKYPGSVFYAITRLLAVNFDPAHPDPLWRFKTSRDTDGKVLIHGDDGITTFPIVLFGLVVRSTLLYIKKHIQSEVTELGIRLPSGAVINDADLKGVSEKIGTKLVIV